MKKYLFQMIALLCVGMLMTSCSSDDENQPVNEAVDNTNEVVDNTEAETRSFSKVLERVKTDMTDVDFEDLTILVRSLREGTAKISCTDHDSAGINKAVAELRVLLENFFAVKREAADDSAKWRLGDLSMTLQLAVDACVAFEKTADNNYIGERVYEHALNVNINDTMSYLITYRVEKDTQVALADVGVDALRTLTINKNGTTVMTIANDQSFDLGAKDKKVYASKQTKGSVDYKQRVFSLDRAWYNTDSVVSHLNYSKEGGEVLGLMLKGESNLTKENLLHHDVVFKGELGASFYGGAIAITSNVNNMNALLVESMKLAGIAVKGTTKEKCQEYTDAFNAVIGSKVLAFGVELGSMAVEPVAVDSACNIYRPELVVTWNFGDNEKLTVKELLDTLRGMFDSLLKD